jgi:hypothetical protein
MGESLSDARGTVRFFFLSRPSASALCPLPLPLRAMHEGVGGSPILKCGNDVSGRRDLATTPPDSTVTGSYSSQNPDPKEVEVCLLVLGGIGKTKRKPSRTVLLYHFWRSRVMPFSYPSEPLSLSAAAATIIAKFLPFHPHPLPPALPTKAATHTRDIPHPTGNIFLIFPT